MRLSLELVAKNGENAVERGDVVVVIDVLRCTSSIITALAHGAKSIIPVRTVKEARKIYRDNPNYILAGERKGLKPKGFTLGNSPLAFTKNLVEGKKIVITTTSGTVALSNVKGSRWVLIGAMLNAKYVAEAAYMLSEKEDRGISLVLSGSRGTFSLEDFLGAGAIIDTLPKVQIERDDAAYAAFLAFNNAKDSLIATLQDGVHGRNLQRLGFGKDVVFCSQLNRYKIVPHLKNNEIAPIDNEVIDGQGNK
jgi:2-phosphosulfolactate phosphatase